MNTDKKYIVFDAYVFGLRNVLAYIRPLFFTGLFLVLLLLGGIGLGAFSFKSLFQGMMHHMSGMGAMAETSRAEMMMQKLTILWEARWIIPPILLALLFFISLIKALYANYALSIFDDTATQKVVFPSFMKIIKIMIAKIIHLIVFLIGLLLFIAPGIYWIIKTQFVDYAILDGAGIFEAFGKSFTLSKGYGWAIFAYLILVVTLGAFLPIALFFYCVALFACGFMYRTIQKGAI